MGLVVGAAGVVGLGVAGGFALAAKSTYDASVKSCEPGNPNVCDQTGVDKRGDARTFGDVASIAVGVGAVALFTGGVLWLTAPRAERTTAASVAIVPALGGATVAGTW
jgi:hypothetical protein